MDVEENVEDVIDTSDAEEKELLDAQKPGYYSTVWGASEHTGGLRTMDTEIEGCGESHEDLPFVRLQPQTPVHKRHIADPSPIFSRLQISPKHNSLDAPSATPATTPVLLTSNSRSRSTSHPLKPSSVYPSSPLDGFHVRKPQPPTRPPNGRAFLNKLDEPDSSPDPLSLLLPFESIKQMAPSHVDPRSGDVHGGVSWADIGDEYTNGDRNVTTSSTSSTDSSQNSTTNFIHGDYGPDIQDCLLSSSPPLEFPPSLVPGPFSLPQVKAFSTDPSLASGGVSTVSELFVPLPQEITSQVASGHVLDAESGRAASFVPPNSFVSPHNVTTDDPTSSSPTSRVFSSSRPEATSFLPLGIPACSSAARTPDNELLRSMSPLTPPPSQPSSSRIPAHPAPVSPPIIIPPDPESQGRAYSLRHRSAKQLNPFAYDKRQYKQMLRGMPEAIVKDPNVGRGRMGRRERYHEDGLGEDEWENEEGDADGNGDGDEEWRAREKRKEKQRETAAIMREFGIEPPSSEEDDVLRVAVGSDDVRGNEGNTRGKKRKRILKARRFPVNIEPENVEASSSVRRSRPPATPPPRPRPRPRPAFLEPSPIPSSPARRISTDALNSPMDIDHIPGVESDAGRDNGDPTWPIENQMDGHNFEKGPSEGARESPILVEIVDDDEVRPWSRKRCLRRGRSDRDDSDVQILDYNPGEAEDAGSVDGNSDSQSSNSTDDVEMTEKDRKRLKAMRRMMPAAQWKKLMAQEQVKARQKTNMRPQDGSEDETDGPLQPGRGRKRIVSPGSRDSKKYKIKGDPESESESHESPTTDREVIVVDDDDGSEEDAERAFEVSDGGLDDGDIKAWLSPDILEGGPSGEPGHVPRRRRSEFERDKPRGGDLIDRMLQRTKRVGPQQPRPTKKRKSKPRGPRNPTFDIVTREARRLGAGGGRQTKLAFPKRDERAGPIAGKRPDAFTEPGHFSAQVQVHHIETRDEQRKSKKTTRGTVQSLLIIPPDGRKVTSGRRRQVIHVNDDDDAFHEVLAPEEPIPRPRPHSQSKAKIRSKDIEDMHKKFRPGVDIERDAFDVDMNGTEQRYSHITLDFDIPLLPAGITFGSDSYSGKGRLHDLIAVLKGDVEVPTPISTTVFGLQVDSDMPLTQIPHIFAAACDKLYDASVMATDESEASMAAKVADISMHALCQTITFKALNVTNDESRLLVTSVTEQINHLLGRINERIEMISADGHSLDERSFTLLWFAVEVHLRLTCIHQRRTGNIGDAMGMTMHTAERYGILLLRRLLEYGLDRTLAPLQHDMVSLDNTCPNVRTLEVWTCVFHVAPFLRDLSPSDSCQSAAFWQLVEAAMDTQSNKQDSQLHESERIWRTTFSLCAVSQFSLQGLTTPAVRLEAHWPIIKKALKCIRLSADERRDNSKSASTLQKRDAYLRMVTARCFLLCIRCGWRLSDADDMFHALCAIFRSRQFSNLLGEPDDFPKFIRERDETLFDVYMTNDTAYGLFLKLVVRAARDFPEVDDTGRPRGAKLSRLLNLAVPVGATSFTRATPPAGQGLSMLYNRYSAIFVAIYVDPSSNQIRARLQQIRRYITFKDADYDSRAAAIRSMMHVAILLRHLKKPLDDILSWASEMIDDLLEELASSGASHSERDKILVLVQLLLGSFRIITNTPTLSHLKRHSAEYPDIGFLRAWIPRILSNPVAKDHRTGLEICKCIQSFLGARRAILPPPPLPKPALEQHYSQESQDEYGDGGLDLNDPALLALLDDYEESPDIICVVDQKASEFMDGFSRPLYTGLCTHLGCNSATFGSPYYEAEQWLDCWLGYGSVLVRNRKRDWTYYFHLGSLAWQDINDPYRRVHLRLRFMLTVLQLDPHAYDSHRDQALELWFESIVSPKITIQHEFTARLLSVDGLRHVLFRNLPCAADPNTCTFTFDVPEFEQLRLPLINAILCNLAKALEGIGTEATRCISFVETLINTMRKWVEAMQQDDLRRSGYVEFGRKVIAAVLKIEALIQHPRLHDLLSLGNLL